MGQPQDMKHFIVFEKEGRFCGWPANNGVWSWPDDEILVGFSNGPWVEKKGHNIGESILSYLGRSRDGGETWSATDPQNYVGDGGVPRALPGAIDFAHPDFAMRIVGTGYHGTDDPRGGFFFSNNRDKREIRARLSRDEGHSWGDERILRSDFQADSFDDPDLGYPRAVERSDGRVLAFYYWATVKHPHNHIAATIWDPE